MKDFGDFVVLYNSRMCVCVFSRVGGIFFIRGVEGGGESERGLSHHRFLRLFGEPSPFFFFFMVFCRFFSSSLHELFKIREIM